MFDIRVSKVDEKLGGLVQSMMEMFVERPRELYDNATITSQFNNEKSGDIVDAVDILNRIGFIIKHSYRGEYLWGLDEYGPQQQVIAMLKYEMEYKSRDV